MYRFLLVLLLLIPSLVKAQSTNCSNPTPLPFQPGVSQELTTGTYYFELEFYEDDVSQININISGTDNYTVSYGFTCSTFGAGTSTSNDISNYNVNPAGQDFLSGCPVAIVRLVVPPIDTTNDNQNGSILLQNITLNPNDADDYVCPEINNLEISISNASDPLAYCTNAGVQDLMAIATNSSGQDICLDDVGTFSGSGVTNTGNNTGTFDPLLAGPGTHIIQYNYLCPSGASVGSSLTVEVNVTPIAELEDEVRECISPSGSIFLSDLLTENSSSTGTWTKVSGPGSSTINGSQYNYSAPGCYEFMFTADDPDGCYAEPPSATAFYLITTIPTVDFNLSTTGQCMASGTTLQVEAMDVNVSGGATQQWTVEANNGTPTNVTMPYTISAPASGQSVTYEFCLNATNVFDETCNSVSADMDCSNQTCRTVTVFNDGLNCQSNCESVDVQACPISVDPYVNIGCSFFSIDIPFEIVGSEIDPESQLLSCVDTEACFDYNSTFAGFDPNVGVGGQTIGSLPGISIICDVFNFCICIELPLVPDIEFRPFSALYNALGCDKTLAQFIFDAIGNLIGDGGGAIVVADTDGDGAFDYEVDEGSFPLSGDACIPINVGDEGSVTVRMVSAWPNMPVGVCGSVTAEGTDLLELLPIGSIPLVGPQIEDILTTAGCNVPLSWSNEKTVTYKVINDQAPIFVNCPTDGYVFAEDLSCDVNVNFSIPVARDGCNGDILDFVDNNDGTPGVRHISGPMPGDDLDIGTYTVIYEATACNGLTTQCSFPIVVETGDPQLQAPNDIVVSTDTDLCSAVVVGLAPLKGIGCSTEITYTTSGATILAGVGDISGSTFNLGVTTVTYTLTYDPDGNPDTDNNVVLMDEFTVTVEDNQKPIIDCVELELTLDSDGNVVVTADDLNGLSSDNCTLSSDLELMISIGMGGFQESYTFDCMDEGHNFVTLRVRDEAGNESFCLSSVNIIDYFEEFQLALDVPEICLEAPNPEQLDFSNYLSILRPDGVEIKHDDVPALGANVFGAFSITSFIPSAGNTGMNIGTSPADPQDIGYIDPMTGMYTPGSGTGFVTVSYLIGISDGIEQNDNGTIEGCYRTIHETFELKQPITMGSPECECLDVNFRAVDLGIVEGGLEPYRLEYVGGVLDIDRDGTPDDTDGIYTFDEMSGYDITDVQEDVGRLLLNYTTPAWSITIIDARGCEISRSGSCDNPDLQSGPVIDCQGVNDFDSEVRICQQQYSWMHAIPYDNCAVTQYSYTITNPDGTIAGPFSLDALIDDANTGIPLEELQEASYNFQEGLSVVSYYAEDAVGNIATCSFNVTVSDNDPPSFINCPMPDVIVNTETGECDAYVNFALPLAVDNCGNPIEVMQIDDTGLSSGSRFPIGLTILTFKAEDNEGNKTICKVKIIVNDFSNAPESTCPGDRIVVNDEWLCSAVVDNIPPLVEDLCSASLITTWQVENAGQVIGTGLEDASGFTFPAGVSTVTYRVQDQPLLLISEVAQDADHLLGGMNPPPIVNEFQCISNLVDTLGNGGPGEGLTFYPVDARLYHTSGNTDGDEYFEEIFLNPFCVQPNRASGDTYGPPAAGEITGMVYHNVLEKFVLMDENGDIFQSSTTGVFTMLSSYAGANPLRGFAYVSGSVYGVDPVANTLVEFDPLTGSIINTSPTGVTGLQGITYNTVTAEAYVIYTDGGTTSNLGTIDLNTGSVTLIENTGVDYAAIAFDDLGNLFGVSSDSAVLPSALYQIYCQVPGDDYIEITNFGPSTYDISCLVIERTLTAGGVESFTVPEGVILGPGNVLVLHFGPGVDNFTGPDYFYNLPSGTDQAAGTENAYSISFKNNIIDEITMFSDANAGIVRIDIFDTDTAEDFHLAEDCESLSLGVYNPYYPEAIDNGSSASLQSEPTSTSECSFTITVNDVEAPMCMELDEEGDFSFTTEGGDAQEGECNQSVTAIPEGNDCILQDININIQGSIVNAEFITITLIAPDDKSLVLYSGGCSGSSDLVDITFDDEATDTYSAICDDWQGTVRPQTGMLMEFFSSKSAGDWTLDINVDDGEGASFNLTSWTLSGSCLETWEMEDVTIENEIDECGSDFTWIHPFAVDNCADVTISVEYYSEDIPEIMVPEGGVLTDNFGKGGYEVTEFFEVGTTTVEYTLVDGEGNMSQCSFNVTVLDTQNPEFTICPDDIFVQLAGGECRTSVTFNYAAEDNCSIDTIIATPPSGSLFEIGETEVVIVAYDPAGNTDTCRFLVVVAENIPENNDLTCNDEINLSLDLNCEATLRADMLLEGSDYRCYENYCIEIEDFQGNPHANYFDRSDAGQRFTVSIVDCMNPEGIFNICWGYVNIEEKYTPEILCPETYTLKCNQDPDAVDVNGNLITGEVEILNCEPNATITYGDEYVDYDNCDNPRRQIFRTWRVEDEDGNIAECTQEIIIEALDLDDIVFPNDISFENAIDCYDASQDPEILKPSNTGYPMLDGIDIRETGALCMISRHYHDEIYEICPGSYEILRIWKIRNMCLPLSDDNPLVHTQIIKVLDNNDPKFHNCPSDTIVSTRPWACLAEAELPLPDQIYDHCSRLDFNAQIFGGGTVEITGSLINGDLKVIGKNMAKGDHRVVYRVEDECGNVSRCEFIVTVADLNAPVVTTKKDIVISITNGGPDGDGSGKLYVNQIDNGSYDVCTDVWMELRRPDAPVCGNEGLNGHNNNVTFRAPLGNFPPYTNGQEYSSRDTDAGEFVKFCCADINSITVDGNGDGVIDDLDRGYVEVVLRVWDDADGNGVFGTAGDNYNDSWSFVKVEEKLPPVINCPEDAVIYCDWPVTLSSDIGSGFVLADDSIDFSKTGKAVAYGACGELSVYYNDRDLRGDCGYGKIIRTWQARSGSDKISICIQEITVEERDEDTQFMVSPPIRTEYSGWESCTLTEADLAGVSASYKPSVTSGVCDVVGESVTIETFDFEEGVCKKWAVTYNYYNWCTDEEAGPFTVYYFYEDTGTPELQSCEDQMYAVDANCESVLTLSNIAIDTSGCSVNGWMKWQVFVDLWGDGTVDYYGSSYTGGNNWSAIPGGDPSLPAGHTYSQLVYVKNIGVTASGDAMEVVLDNTTIIGSMSNHKVKWKVTDGCHNFATCAQDVMVVDKKPPTPYCVDVSTAIMQGPNKMVELWAIDFDQGAFDNCTSQDDLWFTFYEASGQFKDTIVKSGGVNYLVNADVPHYFDADNSFVDFASDGVTPWNGVVYPKTKNSTLDQYQAGISEDGTGVQRWRPQDRSSGAIFREAKVWQVAVNVWDSKCNTDFCEVMLTITDNGVDGGLVGGKITSENGEAVGDVLATISTTLSEYPSSVVNDEEGFYEFIYNPLGYTYSVTASKNESFRNGCSTIDLVRIQQHILGVNVLDSPYKVIAADVSGNERVDPVDLLWMRKLILHVTDDIPGNVSWKFVDASQEFEDVLDPWPIREYRSTGALNGSVSGLDFIGVKVGDVNGSAKLRSDQPLIFYTEDRPVKAGEAVSVVIKSEAVSSLYGTQLTLKLNGLSYERAENGIYAVGGDKIAKYGSDEVLFSLTRAEGVDVAEGSVMFTLQLRAEKSGMLSDMIRINSRVLSAESYVGMSLDIRPTQLEVRGETMEDMAFELYQNEPNPFRETTVIGYDLPENGNVNFRVLDVTGKIVLERELEGKAGYNTIQLTERDVEMSGVLYYQLKSGDYTATKKMVSIK